MPTAPPETEKRSWVVHMTAKVTKEVVTDECTLEQAEKNPFGHAVAERETGQFDYDVTSVEPNV